jgi:3-oxoacyl-[acyl-carrier-protein] synthase II
VRSVVITGVGCVTPAGTGAEGFWAGLRSRHSPIRTITRFDPEPFRTRIAAEVPEFHPQDHMPRKSAKRFDRFSQLGVAAARLAVDDAELVPEREDRDRVGVSMGSALGGIAHAEEQLPVFLTKGIRSVDTSLALGVFGGAVSCNIAIAHGFTGPNSTNSMSCASGTIAVGDAFRAIRSGLADVMLAGGAEAPLAPLCFGAFAVIRAMSTRNDEPGTACRPFDKGRDGFVMGKRAAPRSTRRCWAMR